jgi:beta-N-acetylhexosaminidase
MLKSLTKEQAGWVESTLASMSLEERVGHLIEVADRRWPLEEWKRILDEVPMGMVILDFCPDLANRQNLTELIQTNLRIPAIIGTDMEGGPGWVIGKVGAIAGATLFPSAMAFGAVGDPGLMKTLGRCTAVEGRYHGVHWALAPVLDLSINGRNPGACTRSLGDDPDQLIRLAVPWIQAIQEGGFMAACGKHFPGDGADDRNPHKCTSVNVLTVEEWWDTYGRVWKSAIDAGLMSALVGHISFPAYEGYDDHPWDALPGTLSRRVQEDLLRGELGFKGLVVSDAATMGGMTSRLPASELAVQNITSGSDVFLCFDDPRPHYRLLLEAVRKGRISEERMERSVRRVLEMKARLGLYRATSGSRPTEEDLATFRSASQETAERSITLLRASAMTPVRLSPGSKVLTVTIKREAAFEMELPFVDEELRRRGLEVEHLLNPSHRVIMERLPQFDCVFVNFSSRWERLGDDMYDAFWYSWWIDNPKVVFTSFGSPHMIYDLPHVPNMWLTYDPCEPSQRAIVKAWLGERAAQGICPVVVPLVYRCAEVIQAEQQPGPAKAIGPTS